MVKRLAEPQRHRHRKHVEACGVLSAQEHMMISTPRVVFRWSPAPKWIPCVDRFVLIFVQKVAEHQESEVLQESQGFKLAGVHVGIDIE